MSSQYLLPNYVHGPLLTQLLPTPHHSQTGVLCAFGSWYGVVLLKHKWRIDDALDVSSIHGIPGAIGAFAVGVFAQNDINPLHGDDGWIAGKPVLLLRQAVGILVAVAWAGFWTYVILKIKQKSVGIQVSPEDEERGLDAACHNQSAAYNLLGDVTSPYGSPRI